MKGIWWLSVHLEGTSFQDNYALARIILDIILFVCIVYARSRLSSQQSSTRNKFWEIRYGADVLILWYILTIVDLFLHEGQLKTKSAYILYDFPLTAARFATDILILTGTSKVISDKLESRFGIPRAWPLICELVILVLMVMALYQLGSLLATIVLWTRVADPSMISSVASYMESFEAAFFSIQWLLTFAMLGGAVWLWDGFRTICLPNNNNNNNNNNNAANNANNDREQQYESACMFGAAAILWLRSLVEFAIVIRFHYQHHRPKRNTWFARDVIYGLCTFILLLLLHNITRHTSSQNSRSLLQSQMEGDFRRHVLETVDGDIAASERPPDLGPILQHMRRNPDTALSDGTKQALADLPTAQQTTLTREQGEYLKRLQERYESVTAIDPARED